MDFLISPLGLRLPKVTMVRVSWIRNGSHLGYLPRRTLEKSSKRKWNSPRSPSYTLIPSHLIQCRTTRESSRTRLISWPCLRRTGTGRISLKNCNDVQRPETPRASMNTVISSISRQSIRPGGIREDILWIIRTLIWGETQAARGRRTLYHRAHHLGSIMIYQWSPIGMKRSSQSNLILDPLFIIKSSRMLSGNSGLSWCRE